MQTSGININPNLVGSLGTAKSTTRGEYLVPGHNYHVVITKCDWIKSRDDREFFVVNFDILASDCPTMGAGRKPSYMINMKNDAAQGNLGSFLRYGLTSLAAKEGQTLDVNDDAYWENVLGYDLLVEVCGQANILVGTELWVYAKPIKTKANKDFTIHEWSLNPLF